MDAMRGKCLRCLAGGHRAADCREPVRCLYCRRIGHKARDCSKASHPRAPQASAVRPLASSAPPPPDLSSFPPLPRRSMPAPGDPATRPEGTNAVAAATSEMEKEAARLSSCAVVLDLCRGQGDVEPEEVNKVLRVRFGVQRGDVKVSRHRPENFLAVFKYPHHRDAAVALERLPVGTLDFRIWPWRILPYGDRCALRHHVRLCLEGVPAHAWNESVAKWVIARVCDIDYVEARSLRRDDTRALCLWAWTDNPSDIPKVTWLTITDNAVQVHDGAVPPRGRRRQTFRVIVHLDLLELPPDSHGRIESRDFTWHYGIVDGERTQHERHDLPPPEANPEARHGRRRVDDDEEERHGHRHGKSEHRCLSRATERARKRERSDSRHGRCDRSTAPDGCRREELEKQESHERHMKRQEQGKTEQARKDLERLTLIRQQRAEAAKKREEEKAAKEERKAEARK